jgi:hypothetical protein
VRELFERHFASVRGGGWRYYKSLSQRSHLFRVKGVSSSSNAARPLNRNARHFWLGTDDLRTAPLGALGRRPRRRLPPRGGTRTGG